jgi:hypothetical protein
LERITLRMASLSSSVLRSAPIGDGVEMEGYVSEGGEDADVGISTQHSFLSSMASTGPSMMSTHLGSEVGWVLGLPLSPR